MSNLQQEVDRLHTRIRHLEKATELLVTIAEEMLEKTEISPRKKIKLESDLQKCKRPMNGGYQFIDDDFWEEEK